MSRPQRAAGWRRREIGGKSAAAADLPALLDTCTVLGIEALVEVHTPDEVTLASELGASLLLVNQASRP